MESEYGMNVHLAEKSGLTLFYMFLGELREIRDKK